MKLIRANINDEFDGRWGIFLPYLRLNVDQILLPFVFKKIEPIITLKKATNSTKVEYG